MKYCLTAFLLLLTTFFLFPTPALALTTGVQLASDKAIERLVPSQYKYDMIKYQYSMGSDQPIEQWIRSAKAAPKGGYKVMVSVAKNNGRIPTLKDQVSKFTNQYCPYDDELEERETKDAQGRVTGKERESAPVGNGYIEFMKQMEQVGRRIGNDVEAIEVWNEPNLKDEWDKQNLGPISPKNYAVFLECGVKGLRRAGFNKTVISAALAPLSGDYDDLRFLNELVVAGGLTGPVYKGKYEVDCIGWHGNVTENISPDDPNPHGFQRINSLLNNSSLNKGKPVCITEFGWARDLAGIDRSKQSKYISQAFTLAPTLGNIQIMSVWNFGFTKDGAQTAENNTFAQWDIEGSDSVRCVPEESLSFNKNYPDTRHVVAPTLVNDDMIGQAGAKGLFPEQVNTSSENTAAKITKVQADVQKGFLAQVPGLTDLLTRLFGCFDFGPFGFCSPNIALGYDKELLAGKETNGQNTEVFAQRSHLLANSFRPDEVEVAPAPQDCNIGKFADDNESYGNEKLDTLSTDLGTNTGWYTADIPELIDTGEIVVDRTDQENISIATKLFSQDQRVPDIDTRCKIYAKGAYAVDIGLCDK